MKIRTLISMQTLLAMMCYNALAGVYSQGIYSAGTTYYNICSFDLPFAPYNYEVIERDRYEDTNGCVNMNIENLEANGGELYRYVDIKCGTSTCTLQLAPIPPKQAGLGMSESVRKRTGIYTDLAATNAMRLKIQLLPNWVSRSDLPGPAAFSRQGSASVLQVSWAEYQGDKVLPKLDGEGMRKFAVNFGREFGELVDSTNGVCGFGVFGTAIFRSAKSSRMQIWIITDNRDHILATHICSEQPTQEEIAAVQQIAKSLALGPEQPTKAH